MSSNNEPGIEYDWRGMAKKLVKIDHHPQFENDELLTRIMADLPGIHGLTNKSRIWKIAQDIGKVWPGEPLQPPEIHCPLLFGPTRQRAGLSHERVTYPCAPCLALFQAS